MKPCKPTKTWEKTRLGNLVRHKSGRYYARAFAGGKEVWKSLKTSHFSVAQARLAEFLKEPSAHRQWRWRSLGQDDLRRARCGSPAQSRLRIASGFTASLGMRLRPLASLEDCRHSWARGGGAGAARRRARRSCNAIDYAKHRSCSHDAVIRVYDERWQRDRDARAQGRVQRVVSSFLSIYRRAIHRSHKAWREANRSFLQANCPFS